jgi:hypothetical protein
MRFVTGQVAAAINEALDRMKPAELRVASGEAKGKIAYNYYAPGLDDRRVNVLQMRALDGQPIGTLINYAIHPEVIGSSQGILSPDLVGPLLREHREDRRRDGLVHERSARGHGDDRQPQPRSASRRSPCLLE